MKKIFLYISLILFFSVINFIYYVPSGEFSLIEFFYYSNSLIIFILATILTSLLLKEKWYLSGVNLDLYSLRDFCIGSLLGIVSIVIITLFSCLLGAHIYYNESILTKDFFSDLLSILNNVGVEELIFRGVIFQVLFYKWNKIGATIISSLLFLIAHIFTGSTSFLLMLNTFIAGLLFCFMYIQTKSLWLPFSFHSFWNIGMFLVFEHTAEKTIYSNSIFNLVFEQNNHLASIFIGSTYGFENGLLCTLILCTCFYITTKLKPSYRINAAIYKQEFN